jgi:hypothetical protein
MTRDLKTLGPGTARFSLCTIYRYELTRELRFQRPPLVAIGLNPSTARADVDDPTIRKESGFAKRWGFGRLIKVNAYGYRATDPDAMFAAQARGTDIVGPENDAVIAEAIVTAQRERGSIFVGWGKNIEPARQRAVAKLFASCDLYVYCIKSNLNGTPKHPLYTRNDSQSIRWTCP